MPDVDKDALTKIAKQTRQRYEKRFKEHGIEPRSLGWGSLKHQITRFAQVRRLVDLKGCHVLDIGCGFGDLYTYLKDQGIPIRYTGIDLCEEFINTGRQRHLDGEFLCLDFATDDTAPEADVVLILGVLNYRQTETSNLDYAATLIRRAFDKTNKTVVCDFISLQRTPTYPEENWIYYYNPQDVIDIAMTLTSNWQLVQDYPCIPQREMMLKLVKV